MRRRSDVALWLASAATSVAVGVYLAASHGRLDFQHYALGRDFVNAWTAGHLVRQGRAVAVFDPPIFLAEVRRLFDSRLPFHFWSYPPSTLLMVAPLGWTRYFTGMAAWTTLGLLALAVALRVYERGATAAAPARLAWLLLLAPATAVNIALGQNGAFSAALLIAGLALADRRPWMAGAWLGLLIFKPQIAILLPVMALAGGRWRLVAGAAATAATTIALSLAVFGLRPWGAFITQTLPLQTQMLRSGHGPFQPMMPSAYMAARMLKASWPAALAAQLPFTAIGVGLVWWAWRRRGTPIDVRAGVLMAATFVASPQAFNYDLIPLALTAILLWRRDPTRLGRTLAFAAWSLPPLMAAAILHPVSVAWRLAPVAPLVLTGLTLRLAYVGGLASAIPRLARKASTAAEAGSNR